MKAKAGRNGWVILLLEAVRGNMDHLIKEVVSFLGEWLKQHPYDILGMLTRIWTFILLFLFTVAAVTPYCVPAVISRGYLALTSCFMTVKEGQRWYQWKKGEKMKSYRKGEIFVMIWWIYFLLMGAIPMFEESYHCPKGLMEVAIGVLIIYVISRSSKEINRCIRKKKPPRKKRG